VLHSGKRFPKKGISSPSVALGEEVNKRDGVDDVKLSPRGSLALGEGFPKCTRFGTRGRWLPREKHPRRPSPSVAQGEAFPECFGAFLECIRHSGKAAYPVVIIQEFGWKSQISGEY
jgi:hypothetical protein